jgi:hypothetical protein
MGQVRFLFFFLFVFCLFHWIIWMETGRSFEDVLYIVANVQPFQTQNMVTWGIESGPLDP